MSIKTPVRGSVLAPVSDPLYPREFSVEVWYRVDRDGWSIVLERYVIHSMRDYTFSSDGVLCDVYGEAAADYVREIVSDNPAQRRFIEVLCAIDARRQVKEAAGVVPAA